MSPEAVAPPNSSVPAPALLATPAVEKPATWQDYGVYLLVRFLVMLLDGIGKATALMLADGFAYLANDLLKIRRKITLANIRAAYPDRSEAECRDLARRMWRHLVLFVIEIVHLHRKVHDTNWRDHVRVIDGGVLVDRMLSGRPVIVVSAHFGNFEMANVMCGLLGIPTHAVARALDNPHLDAYLNRLRTRTGQAIIPKTGGFDWIVDVLAANGGVAFLADQNAGPKGCRVDFFGRPASAHKSIAVLSLQFEAPIVIAYCRRAGDFMKYELVLGEQLDPRTSGPEYRDVKRITDWYTRRLEEFIRRDPEQYWWLHDRWKESVKRPAKRPAKAA